MARASAGSKNKGKQAANKRTSAADLRANAATPASLTPEPLAQTAGPGAARDVAGVILAVFAVASLIAVFSSPDAPLTAALSSFYHMTFGLGAYIVPLVLLGIAALIFVKNTQVLTPRVVAGCLVIFVALLAMLSLSAPHTNLSTVGMFEPYIMSSYGGYVGAVIASTMQGALGKTVSMVVLIGVTLLGLIVVGFSLGGAAQSCIGRITELKKRFRPDPVSVNQTPWGGKGISADHKQPSDSDASPAAGMKAAKTSFLGRRTTTVLDQDDDADEDPFVDVSDQLAEESAPTRLIPVPERTATLDAQEVLDLDDTNEDLPPNAANASLCLADEDSIFEPDSFDSAIDLSEKSQSSSSAPSPQNPTSKPSVVVPDFLKPHAQAVPDQSHLLASDAQDERELPPMSLLRHNPASAQASSSSKELEQTAGSLQATLAEFGLRSRVVGWIAGPTVTTFKVQPGEGERVSRISNLEDDIALSLAADAVRIFAPIPGTSLVGIEIPNRTRQTVAFGDILPYTQGGPLEFALGRDAEGQPMVADLAKMPHLLIAGTTGSGKSVVISSIVMSLLMRTFPEDVRLIMVDPKRVEFAPYDGLPHLYVPVVTEPKQAASALQWAVSEMERRLKIFERIGVRKIATFNEKQAAGEFDSYDNPPAKMPYLVIVIDELSDLMMVAGKDVEASIVRIAQLGRAAGIHMIVATQRPSSNVVTGLIKANITNRIGLTVATGIDSRVILDQTGAEKLIGQGDMLFSRVDWGKPKRIQGCYVSDDEIFTVVEFVKEHCEADYHEEILSAVAPAQLGSSSGAADPGNDDPLVWEAAHIVVETQLGSTSGLQRRLKVGYARAGRIMDMLEEKGIVGPPDGSKPREVLLDAEGLAELQEVEARMRAEDGLGGF